MLCTSKIHPFSVGNYLGASLIIGNLMMIKVISVESLEESLSISTGLATRPSRLTPKKCINKSIWLATGGHLPGANKIDLFMHFPTHESRWPRLKWTSFLLVNGRG
jgi:hypothetical protein